MAEEAERQRQEAARLATEAEAARKAEEARIAAEAEAQRQAAAEQSRREEEARQRALAEQPPPQPTPQPAPTPGALEQIQSWQPRIRPEEVTSGVAARTKDEFDRFGDILNLEDLNSPNLSLTDRYYLAGLAFNQNPTDPAAEENFRNWQRAMQPEAAAVERTVQQRIAPIVSSQEGVLRGSLSTLEQKLAEARQVREQAVAVGGDVAAADAHIGFLENARNQAADALSKLGSTVSSASGDVLNLLSTADVLPPEAVDAVFNKVLDTVGVDSLPALLGPEGTQSMLEAAGVASDILGSGVPVVSIISDIASGSSVGQTAANAAKAYAIAQVASIPGVGPAIAAAVALDSVLSNLLGYRSPINEVVSAVGKNVDKALSWTSNQVLQPVARAVERAFTIPRSIRKRFRFQEGGLVDLGEDSMYNTYDFYGGLSGLPQDAMTLEPVPPVLGFAGGGVIPLVGGGKVAIGPGGGLDDLIPTSINGRQAAALSDGEFVIPADVVSMMGDGSSNAGARRLYDLVKQIRQAKTGTDRQAGPLPTGKILERVMK